ncbi:MAG: hypothetical protein NUV84_03635 [Candidatus Uhrbacteria bacterium]|nr:hypothetical protein [Candidatus Uhrbacteria bacterium]
MKTLFLQKGIGEGTAGLITAMVGELANNAFDHNLGKWRDIRGCWLETAMNNDQLTIYVADRGQGVTASLSRVRPGIDDLEAIRIAFAEHVTGRAPEKRGNGLKFVMNVLHDFEDIEFSYYSGNAWLHYSSKADRESDIKNLVSKAPVIIRGVYANITIKRFL